MWITVKSSNLAMVNYDREEQTLRAIFVAVPEVVYTYRNVSWEDYEAVIRAKSVGAEFNRRIRSRPDLHPYRKRRLTGR